MPHARQVDTARAAQRFDLSGYGGIGAMEVRNRETLTVGAGLSVSLHGAPHGRMESEA